MSVNHGQLLVNDNECLLVISTLQISTINTTQKGAPEPALKPATLGRQSADSATAQRPHYAYLDALRGWAFLSVLLVHSGQQCAGLPKTIKVFSTYGAMGVQLFFVLSALTLLMSMQSRRRNEKRPLQNYFIRRLFRIAPLYWTAALFYLWLDGTAPHFGAPTGIHPVQIFTALTFTHGWSPWTINAVVPGGWSIAVEMTFYLALPILMIFMTTWRRSVAAFVLSVAFSVLTHIILDRTVGPHWKDYPALYKIFEGYWFPTQLPIFLIGAVVYFSIASPGGLPFAIPESRRKAASAILVLIAICIALVLAHHQGGIPASFVLLYGIAYGMLTYGLYLHPWKLLVNRAVCYLGVISFSCYLVHFSILFHILPALGRHIPWNTLPYGSLLQLAFEIVVTLMLTTIAATVTHRLIETTGMSLGKRVIAYNEARS